MESVFAIPINGWFAPYAVVFVANIVLGIYGLLKNPRRRINQLFFFLAIAIAYWQGTTWVDTITQVPEATLGFWAHQYFAGASLIALAMFLIAFEFPKPIVIPHLVRFGVILMGVLAVAFSYSGFLIKGYILVEGVKRINNYGPFYPFFTVYFILLFLTAYSVLFWRYSHSSGIQRERVKYFLFGTLIPAIIGTTTHLIIPNLQQWGFAVSKTTIDIEHAGPLFTILFVGAIAYATVRHRFFGIRFIVRKGTIYLLSVIAALFLYGAIILTLSALIPKPTTASAVAVNLLAVLVIALSFEPLRRFVRRKVDEWFFPERRKIQQEIKRIQERLPREVNFEKYKGELFGAFRTVLKFNEARFLLLDRREGVYREIAPQGKALPALRLDDRMVKYVIGKWRILVRDELPPLMEDLSKVEQEELMGIYTKLKELKAALAMPIGDEKRPEGLFFVDAKPRGDAFTTDELADLETVRFAASQALFNAVLYKETIENLGKVRVG